jgi:hypothetical protein
VNEYEKAPEDMLRAKVKGSQIFRLKVVDVLTKASIPEADTAWDDEKGPVCSRSGYRLLDPEMETGRVVTVIVIGQDGVPDEVRQGERDALTQQIRAALVAADLDARVNEYGHLKVVDG